jgi:hypothetical protein
VNKAVPITLVPDRNDNPEMMNASDESVWQFSLLFYLCMYAPVFE